MTPITISFPAPDVYLSLNDRVHWRRNAERVATWRNCSKLMWTSGAARGDHPRNLEGRWLVSLTLTFPTNNRRDASNYIATLKPIIDGLKDGGAWPDDDGRYVVTAEPALMFHRGDRQVVITLEPIAGAS